MYKEQSIKSLERSSPGSGENASLMGKTQEGQRNGKIFSVMMLTNTVDSQSLE
jgi:hypothetical protein